MFWQYPCKVNKYYTMHLVLCLHNNVFRPVVVDICWLNCAIILRVTPWGFPWPDSFFNFVFLQTPLHLAIITKQPNAVKMLIQEGASVNYPDRRGNTSVHLASSRKELGILHVLSQASNPIPDFNARNFSGIYNRAQQLDSVFMCVYYLTNQDSPRYMLLPRKPISMF